MRLLRLQVKPPMHASADYLVFSPPTPHYVEPGGRNLDCEGRGGFHLTISAFAPHVPPKAAEVRL